MQNPLRRWTLPSKSNSNLRDLGGYACDGGVTRYGTLLRADQIYNLSEEDKAFLLEKGLTDIIDLRSEEERVEYANSFLDHPEVHVHVLEDSEIQIDMPAVAASMTNMGAFYTYMVDHWGEMYVCVLDSISRARGLTIFHCLVGKDRTGVVSALLLLLLGVDERDVIADYQTSATFLKAFAVPKLLIHPDLPEFVVLSDAMNMQVLIEHLNSKYGGATAYLQAHGLTEEMYQGIREKMVAAQ